MRTKIVLAVLVAVAVFQSCKKGGDDDGGGTAPSTNVTVSNLMGTTGKRWPLLDITLTYYNASNGVDSTVLIEDRSSTSSLYFTNNNGSGGLYLNFDAVDKLTKVLPRFGSWALNQATQKITFTCISPYCNGTNGEWHITSYYSDLSGGEILHLELTVALGAGRKVKQQISLVRI